MFGEKMPYCVIFGFESVESLWKKKWETSEILWHDETHTSVIIVPRLTTLNEIFYESGEKIAYCVISCLEAVE